MAFQIADFFAKLSIKADTKEVAKLEKSLNRVKQSLLLINKAGARTKKVTDKIFNGEDLKRKTIQLTKQFNTLKRLGGAAEDYGAKIREATKASQFKKLQNEIDVSIIKQRRLNEVTAKAAKIEKLRIASARLQQRGTGPPRGFVGPRQPKGFESFKAEAFRATTTSIDVSFGQSRKAKKGIDDLIKSLEREKFSTREATLAIKEFARAQRRASKATAVATEKISKQAMAMKRLKSSVGQLAQSFVGAFAVFEGITSINRVGQDFEAMSASMQAVSGSAANAKRDLKFVRDESVRLGLDLKDTTKAFIKLKAGAADKATDAELKNIFKGLTEASAVLGLTTEETTRTIRAVSQMFGKICRFVWGHTSNNLQYAGNP